MILLRENYCERILKCRACCACCHCNYCDCRSCPTCELIAQADVISAESLVFCREGCNAQSAGCRYRQIRLLCYLRNKRRCNHCSSVGRGDCYHDLLIADIEGQCPCAGCRACECHSACGEDSCACIIKRYSCEIKICVCLNRSSHHKVQHRACPKICLCLFIAENQSRNLLRYCACGYPLSDYQHSLFIIWQSAHGKLCVELKILPRLPYA